MDAQLNGKPIWHQLEGEQLAACVDATVDALERTQAERRFRALRNVQIYEGRKLEGLFPSAYFSSYELSDDQFDTYRINLARGLCNTALAKVAGKQRPKAQFCTTDADWSTKRKAKKLEKFVEAVQLQRHGNLQDVWAVGLLAFRDCTVVDMGAIKFEADVLEKRIRIRRVLPWELYFDPYESRNGDPQNLFHVYAYDRYKLLEQFPKYRDAIVNAPSLEEDPRGHSLYGYGPEVARMVKVKECWRLPPSSETPGKHAIVVGNVDLTGGEEYTRSFFPFEWMIWEPWMVGMHGASLVDNVAALCDELNAAAQRWSDGERLLSNVVLAAEEGSIKEEDLESNVAGNIVYYRKGSPGVSALVTPTIGETSIRWKQECKQDAFDISGVSYQSATSQTDAGVTAGVAMRTKENIQSERFSIQWQMFERVMAVGCARQIVACAREIAEKEPDFAVRYANSSVLQEIRLGDVDYDFPDEAIQVYAVSGLVNTPEDRLQLASELFDRQIISQDAYLRVIQAKDIDGELANGNTQSRLIERYIEQWLDATQEDEDNGRFRYRPPIPFMNHEEAILQVGRAYMSAELDDAPDYNLQFFLRFMDQCDKQIQKKAAQQAQLEAAAKGNTAAVQGLGTGAPAPMPSATPPVPGPGPSSPPGAVLQ